MSSFVLNFLTANLGAALAVLAVLAMRKPARAIFGAQLAYALWLLVPLVAAATCLPPRAIEVIRNVAQPAAQSVAASNTSTPAAANEMRLEATLQAKPSDVTSAFQSTSAALPAPLFSLIDPWSAAAAIWLIGVLASFAGQLRNQFRFLADVRSGIAGPAVVGFLRPRLVTPSDFERKFDPRERAIVYAHEKVHLARNDARINTLAAIASSVCWFNPLIYFGVHFMRIDQELACDAVVTERHPRERAVYASALVKAQLASRPLPMGCYWPARSAHPLIERIEMLKRTKPGKRTRRVGFTLLVLLTAGSGVAAWAAQPPRLRIVEIAAPIDPTPEPQRDDPAPTPAPPAAPPASAAKPAPNPVAQIDLSGTWQGTVAFNPPLRGILKISKAPGGGYQAVGYSIDETPEPLTVDTFTLNGSTVKYTVNSLNSSFEGQLSSDGQTIKGKWGPPSGQATLDLVRTTKETEWAINQPSTLLDDVARAGIVAKAADALRNRYIYPDVGETAAAKIEAQLAAGAYSNLDHARPLADKLTADLYAVAKDKHLRILALAGAGAAGGPALPPPPRREAGVVRADRLPGNIGYIEVIGFPPPVAFKPVIDKAMASVAGTKALIIDDRRNGGGSPDGVAYLVSFFLDPAKPIKLNDFVNRTPNSKDFTTQAEMSVATPTSYRGKPVYVLTSARTFSGGEEFAYDMQAFKLATLVGETTGGGANPGGTAPVGAGLAIFLPNGRPVNAVTGTNWEGVGVIPGIKTPVDDALKVALEKVGQKPASGEIEALSLAKLFEPRLTPKPGTEAMAREAVVALANGNPDYSRVAPALAEATRQQLPQIQKMLTDLGELQSVKFREVTPGGLDAYDITFAKGSVIYALALDDQGNVVSAQISGPR